MRGVLFSFGLLLVALAVLSLAVVLLLENSEISKDAARLALFDRLRGEVGFTEAPFSDVLLRVVNITVANDSIAFRERLPNNLSTAFRNNTARLAQFLENHSAFGLRLNTTEVNETLPLILDNGVRYYHDPTFGSDTIVVNNTVPVSSYHLYLYANHSVGNIVFSWLVLNPGTQQFTLNVTTNTRTKLDQQSLNFSQTSLLEVNFTGGGPPKATRIYVGNASDAGRLVIDRLTELTTDIEVTTTIFSNATRVSTGTLNITAETIAKSGALRVR